MKQKNIKNYSLGFTLIELLIVIVILATGAMMAVPMISSASGFQLKSAANMLNADLEYARNLAITTGINHSVVFDTAAETYQIQDSSGTPVGHPVKAGQSYIIDLTADSRTDKVNIYTADFDSTNIVKFDYLGSPFSGANNPLNSGTITLKAAGETKTITVEPITGYIAVQ